MSRCDADSARGAGVSCPEFYRLQALVADQTRVLRAALRQLAMVVEVRSRRSEQDEATAARLIKYMGTGSDREHDRIAVIHNVLKNAENALRSSQDVVKFDKSLGTGGNTQLGYMLLGDKLETNTILHEAVHFGTAVWRSTGGVPFIFDGGNFDSYETYGGLPAALQRARYGWQFASISAASYAWLVTGP